MLEVNVWLSVLSVEAMLLLRENDGLWLGVRIRLVREFSWR